MWICYSWMTWSMSNNLDNIMLATVRIQIFRFSLLTYFVIPSVLCQCCYLLLPFWKGKDSTSLSWKQQWVMLGGLNLVQKSQQFKTPQNVCPLWSVARWWRGLLSDFAALLISSSVSLEVLVMTLNFTHSKWNSSFLWYVFDWCEAVYLRDR